MIITRKIEVHIKKGTPKKNVTEYMQTLRNWRNLVRKAANMIVAHKFVQQNVRDFTYVQEDLMERFLQQNPEAKDAKGNTKFYTKDILKKEKGCSEQNITYRAISAIMKGQVPSAIATCLNQSVSNTYKERYTDFIRGTASIPSYRNIPIPFPGKKLNELTTTSVNYTDKTTGEQKTAETYTFDFFGIPLELFFGRDRSGNRRIIENALSGQYRFCGSSLMIDDERKKMFLLVCTDIPAKPSETDKNKILYAALGFETPIICGTKPELAEDNGNGILLIGNKEEYLHRRLQIQAAMRRVQMTSKYNNGGHGRKKKTAALDRFHEREKNYIDTKTHLYSRLLVNEAVKRGCGIILLTNLRQTDEQIAEARDGQGKFLLRNWSYHNLAQKIIYKAGALNITVTSDQ